MLAKQSARNASVEGGKRDRSAGVAMAMADAAERTGGRVILFLSSRGRGIRVPT